MPIDLKTDVRMSRVTKPPRIVIHGPEKIGKTDFASQAPGVFFIATEPGQEAVNVPMIKANNYQTAVETIEALYAQEHDYQACALDTADWLENLLFKQIAAEENKSHIGDIGYQKGYEKAADAMRFILQGFDALRDEKGMAIIVIAHSEIKRFDDPLHESYDQYRLKLHKYIAPILVEWADIILFATQEVMVQTKEKRFDKKVNKAVGRERVIFTQPAPGYVAGNRIGLPDKLPLSWDAFIEAYGQRMEAIATGEARAAA